MLSTTVKYSAAVAASLLLAGCGQQLQADALASLGAESISGLSQTVLQQLPKDVTERLDALQNSYADAQTKYNDLLSRYEQLKANTAATAESLRELERQVNESAAQLQRNREALQQAVTTTQNTFNVEASGETAAE